MKKRRFVALVIMTAFLSASVILAVKIHSSRENDACLTVNGEPVSTQEFQYYMNNNRNAVTTFFKVQYGVEDQSQYWTKSFHGKKPIDMLKQYAYQDCVRSRVILWLAKKQRIAEDITFQQAIRDYKNNSGVAPAVNQNNIQNQTGFYQYYESYKSKIESNLMEALSENVLSVSDQDIKDFYNAHTQLYTNSQKLTLDTLYFPYDEANKASVKEKASAAELQFAQVGNFKTVCDQYVKDAKISTRTLVPTNDTATFSLDTKLFRIAQTMAVNQLSPVTDGGDGFILFQVVKKETNTQIPLESVSTQIKNEVLRQKFDGYITQITEQAKIVVDQDTYQSVQVH